MSRPRKPTAHLELVGAFKKDPQRRRDAEPQCDEDAMLPPRELTENERMAWDFLHECAVPGVLTKMDSAFLSLCCKALALVWWGEPTMGDIKAAGAMLGQLGMTPSDRSKVVVPKKDKPSGFAAYKK